MSAATRLVPIALLLAAAACGQSDEQNIVIANEVPPDAELEVLPADESATTPSGELANGAADPGVEEMPANRG